MPTSDNDKREVEELTLKIIDGQATEQEAEQLEALIADDESGELARVHLSLLEQEAVLRGNRGEFDLTEPAMEKVRQRARAAGPDRTTAERIEQGVMAQIKRRIEAMEPGWAWLGGRKFWQVAAAAAVLAVVMIGGHTWWIGARTPDPQEAFLYGQGQITPGMPTAFRVFVRDAASRQPVSGARIKLALVSAEDDGVAVWGTEVRSDEAGMALVEPKVAATAPEGSYTLKVLAASARGESIVEKKILLKRSFRVLVTTDKPLYQPGQTIHIRTLSLATADLKPAAKREVVIQVRDAKDNKVFKKRITTSAFGVAAADFSLADQVNLGRYTVSATLGDTTSDKSVTVKRYRLPKYRVTLTTERTFYGPGERVRGDLKATYTFGKPVARARVKIVASEMLEKLTPFATVNGITDGEGRLRFDLPLKEVHVGQPLKKGDAMVSLEATVTDPANHVQKKTMELTITSQPIRVELLPEGGALIPGVDNTIYVVTAYPDGRPAQTEVTIGEQQPHTFRTSSAGVASFTVQSAGIPNKSLTGPTLSLWVSAKDARGRKVKLVRSLPVNQAVDAFLLRTDRAIYRAGETARLIVLAPGTGRGRVFVDAVRDRQTMLVKAIEVEQGRGELALDLPADLFGTVELHAYRVRTAGDLVRDTRVIQVARADQLQIQAELDKETYRPADKAVLKLAVRRKSGEPVQAALGLAGVDEAVFALHELQPGLERIYFMLQEEALKPRYDLHARSPYVASRALEQGPPEDQTSREASMALFIAAGGQNQVARASSELLSEKHDRFMQEEHQHHERLAAGGVIALALLFLCLTLPLVGYGLWRVGRRQPIEDADPTDQMRLGRSLGQISVWWALGFFLPAIHLALLAVVAPGGGEGPILFAALGAPLPILALVMQVLALRRLRRNPASGAVPLLRKLVTPLPAAYGVALGLVAAMIAATSYPRVISEGAAIALVLAVLLAAMLVVSAVAVAKRSVLQPTSVGRLLLVGLGTLGLFVVVPAALVFLMVLAPGRVMYNKAIDVAASPGVADFIVDGARQEERFALSLWAKKGKAQLDPGEHRVKVKAQTRVRRHFPETLLWRPEVITDEQGRASVEIPLADSITTWRLTMSAVSAHGELGAAARPLRVFQDFFVDIDFPVAMTQNDRVQVPVAVYNYLDKPQTVRLELEQRPWFRLVGPAKRTLQIGPKQVKSVPFTLTATRPGSHTVTLRARGDQLTDAVERRVRVVPDGKPVVTALGGRLSAKREIAHAIQIPEQAIEGANDLLVKIYPGSFSQVLESLDNIFQMPYGCFEQTSSTTYPNVLVLDYMRRTKQLKPEIELKARSYINLGYQRLLSFEVPGGGFEWFGKAPAHNVLTAYGVMEFSDMARVHEGVDQEMIQRTRKWLLSKQQGDGTWKPSGSGIAEGAINAYQGQDLRTTAYIAWALAEAAGDQQLEPGLVRGLDLLVREHDKIEDPYTLATIANALVAARRPEARSALSRLVKLAKKPKDKEGQTHWTSTSQGVTYSRGNALDIETTALAAYALLKAKHATHIAHRALTWLIEQKDDRGTWHSTQATVLALRALLAGTEPSSKIKSPVRIMVTANDTPVKTITVTPETSDVFRLVSLRHLVRQGENRVSLRVQGKGALAYQVVATHYLPWPRQREKPSPEPISIQVAYDSSRLRVNDQLTSRVTLKYNRPGKAKMIVVDLGIPPGFDPLPQTFEALKEGKVIERYTLTGRQVTLYLRELGSDKPLSFQYQLRAKHPVRVTTPRARVYEYYQPEVKAEAAPVKLVVL